MWNGMEWYEKTYFVIWTANYDYDDGWENSLEFTIERIERTNNIYNIQFPSRTFFSAIHETEREREGRLFLAKQASNYRRRRNCLSRLAHTRYRDAIIITNSRRCRPNRCVHCLCFFVCIFFCSSMFLLFVILLIAFLAIHLLAHHLSHFISSHLSWFDVFVQCGHVSLSLLFVYMWIGHYLIHRSFEFIFF